MSISWSVLCADSANRRSPTMSMPVSRIERKDSFERKRMARTASLSISGFDARDRFERVRLSETRRKTLRDEICQMLII
jgi:hypothetical protein